MKQFVHFSLFLFSLYMTACSVESMSTEPESEMSSELMTYATFTINATTYAGPKSPLQTKAVADFNPGTTNSGNAATEMDINPADVRLMIFNDVGMLEYNDLFPSNLQTSVLLTAGLKKIFVFANCGNISGFNTLFDSFTYDNSGPPTTFSQFYNSAIFDAGVPQQTPFVNKTTTSRTFSIAPLHTQTASYGLPASSSNQATYMILAGIPQSVSEAGIPSTSEGSATNTFAIDLYFMLAKARLTYNSSALTQLKGTTPIAEITNIRYSIKNLARYTNYVLNVVSGNARSWYYGKTFINSSAGLPASMPSDHYFNHFDDASNANVLATVVAIPQTGPFLYVPESTNSPLTIGQCPYYSFNVQYMPKFVVTAVAYNAMATPKIQFTYTDLSSPMEVNKDYVYLRGEIYGSGGSLEQGTCFKTVDLLRQAAWLSIYGDGWSGTTNQMMEADAIIGTPPPATPTYSQLLDYPFPSYGYYLFTDAQSWYRVNVGSDVGSIATIPYSIPKWGTVRGVAYDTNITEFNGPGVPYEWMFGDYDVPDPVEAMTYVSVQTRVVDWAYTSRSSPAN